MASGSVNDEEQPAGDIALWIFGSAPLDRQVKRRGRVSQSHERQNVVLQLGDRDSRTLDRAGNHKSRRLADLGFQSFAASVGAIGMPARSPPN